MLHLNHMLYGKLPTLDISKAGRHTLRFSAILYPSPMEVHDIHQSYTYYSIKIFICKTPVFFNILKYNI